MSAEFDASKKGLSIGSFIAALAAFILVNLQMIIQPLQTGPHGSIAGIASLTAMIIAVVFGAVSLVKKTGVKAFSVAGLVIGIALLAVSALVLAFTLGTIFGEVETLTSITGGVGSAILISSILS